MVEKSSLKFNGPQNFLLGRSKEDYEGIFSILKEIGKYQYSKASENNFSPLSEHNLFKETVALIESCYSGTRLSIGKKGVKETLNPFLKMPQEVIANDYQYNISVSGESFYSKGMREDLGNLMGDLSAKIRGLGLDAGSRQAIRLLEYRVNKPNSFLKPEEITAAKEDGLLIG